MVEDEAFGEEETEEFEDSGNEQQIVTRAPLPKGEEVLGIVEQR